MGADDEASFDAFFRDANQRLLGQAYLLTADLARAQDLTQEAFERAWVHWRRVSRYERPEAWTRRVLHNLCVSEWRKQRRREERPPGTPLVVAAPSEDHLLLLEVLRSLPLDHARALVLHDGAGLTVAEIAAELSVAEGTVKSWLSRARSRAAAVLGSAYQLEPGGC